MNRLFQTESHVRSMIDADGAVLLDLQAGKYYSLNGLAAKIWLKGADGDDETTIVREICELYDIQEDTARADLRRFVTGLEKKGLIRANS